MHRALLAVPLIASLLFPALWNLLQKEGPGLDPDGLVAPVPPSEAGPGWDPNGYL